MSDARPTTGLLLTGGGARAAYQVGVLEAIADLRREAGAEATGNPFQVTTGTSAGAINAAALACGADDFDAVVRRIARMWRNIRAEQVYRTDSLAALDRSAGWGMLLGIGQLLARWMRMRPRSLLDNTPLSELLKEVVPLHRLPQMMREGHLQALAVTASSYSSGTHFTFFESATAVAPWVRTQREAVPCGITHEHLLASSAIPFVFPATALPIHGHDEYFGDGSMRQSAPIAPAIHLGADRILAIGAGRMVEPGGPSALAPNSLTGYPSMAQIAGHALSSIFLDALAVDVERLQRINHTLSLIHPDFLRESTLRPLKLLLISPSQRIDAIAARHVDALPSVVRRLFVGRSTDGVEQVKAAALASYLLFAAPFTRELVELGRADTLARREAVFEFFGWTAR
ncbi:patatin-like phospholipase family protein [Variovorax sp. J22R133]|uniref:patatin-like phospholipase family protein n=1 Tax=Variovorax brevis TaxID=3053503 RepID=UPI002576C1D5|nr:patatin-like phospholipase family protein [Variovorax sp. J22R133]MDM0112906.1 patatin-like phospholipase family protein [Variovorax sp. J22R133]